MEYDRLESLREQIDAVMHAQPDLKEKRCGFVHLYGVSATCVLLALRRGLDAELAGIAGMVHDIWAYKMNPENHAALGAIEAGRMLQELGCFAPPEIETIQQAIRHHSDKAGRHAPLDELLKDADVFQHYLYNSSKRAGLYEHPRLKRVLAELGVSGLGSAMTPTNGP